MLEGLAGLARPVPGCAVAISPVPVRKSSLSIVEHVTMSCMVYFGAT
jgi:hypothetical protein